MHQSTVLSCLICLIGLIVSARAADKYTDGNRPYEFGFTIEGEQHRHEKKDENGIIMGEFGFITADGVYHVTVYATDENGRFKILSMKNIRVKPYPTAASTGTSKAESPAKSSGGVKKGHSIPFPPSGNTPVVQGPSTSNTAEKSNSPQQGLKAPSANKQSPSPAKSCSHCSIPTTTTKAPPIQLTDIAVVSKDRPTPGTSALTPNYNYPQNTYPNDYQQNTPSRNYPPNTPANNYQQNTPPRNYPPNTPPDNYQQNTPPQNYQQNTPSNNNQQNTPLSSGGQNNLRSQEAGKSFSPSYSGQQSNPLSPGINQNTPQYPQVNRQQSYQQQDLSRNLNPPSDVSKIDYNSHRSQQNYNDYSNSPQSNNYNPQNGNTINQNNFERVGNDSPHNYPPSGNSGDQYYNQENSNFNKNYPPQQPNYVPVQPGSGQDSSVSLQTPNLRNPKQYNDISSPDAETGLSQGFRDVLASQPYQPVSNRPTLVAAQMQIVPKDTDIHHKEPGEKEGLPPGISKNDMTRLLYTFNYTVGFHGHHEEGYSSGAKIGYYFITGRNGIRTRVDYVADENGFRPTISQEVLDLLSDDVPKPETEKDEKFGLKGYEFKWIYYPTNERK